MDYNDYKTPDEVSLFKMNQEYTRNVSATQQGDCADCADKTRILKRIDWNKNDNLLNFLATRTSSGCIAKFIRKLSELSGQDYADLIALYPSESGSRTNPTLPSSAPNTFQGALREYLRTELNLLANLVSIRNLEEKPEQAKTVYNIIERRIEALSSLASLINGGIFG